MSIVENMPYIISIVVAIVSGGISYAAACKKAKAELETLKTANAHDLQKLMEQHKLDLDALKKKHEMELEKINLEHAHQMEIKQMEFNSQLGNGMLTEMMKMPVIREAITKGMQSSMHKKK